MHINELNAVTREQARIRTLLFTIPCKEGWVKREDVLKLLRDETVLPDDKVRVSSGWVYNQQDN